MQMDNFKAISNINLINSEVLGLKKAMSNLNKRRMAVIKELREKTLIDKIVLIDLIDNDEDNSKLMAYSKRTCSTM